MFLRTSIRLFFLFTTCIRQAFGWILVSFGMLSSLHLSRRAEKRKETKTQKRDLLVNNAPVYPDIETLKAEKIPCTFTIVILQPMDQSVIESIKRHYRKQRLRKQFFEGDEEETACCIIQFWKALKLKDCVYWLTKLKSLCQTIL